MAFSGDSVRVFLAVLDHGNFSAAARALGRVPSAISMAVAQLEAELDLVLFDRSSREVRPTDAARALEAEARQFDGQRRRLEAHALALHAGLEHELTVAIVPELLSAPWGEPLAALAETYPALAVRVLSGPQADVLRMLHRREADLALVFERIGFDEREDFLEIGTETLMPVISPRHPLAAKRYGGSVMVDQEALALVRQIVLSGRDGRGAETGAGAGARTGGAGRDGRGGDVRMLLARRQWQTDSHLAALGLVQAGIGWSWLPRRLVAPLIATGTLVAIELLNMTSIVRLFVDVVWLKDRPLGLGARDLVRRMDEARDGSNEGTPEPRAPAKGQRRTSR